MLFSLGIETPENDKFAYGIVVPALCFDKYSCFSAADTESEIAAMATEAIQLMLEGMMECGFQLSTLKDEGITAYKSREGYAFCDQWLTVDVDLPKQI